MPIKNPDSNPYSLLKASEELFEASEELFKASEKGDIEAIKSLLGKGVDVNFIDFYGRTALAVAATKGNKEIVNLLIEKKNKKLDNKIDFIIQSK